MRRLSICFLVLTTLTACGGTTDDGDGSSNTTPDVSAPDTSITPDVTAETDGDEPTEDATDPADDTTATAECVSDDDCATDNVCEVATCDLTSGECATERLEDGAECLLDGSTGVCTEGACVVASCGDGICDANEDADSCSDDCTEPGCADDEVLGCDGETCLSAGMLGDTLCDSALNCEANAWDGGDCDLCGNGLCGTGETATLCPEDCQNGEECGDAICMGEIGEDFDTCPEDCCPTGEVKDCEHVSCISESSLGDGTCDPLLNCDLYEADGGDCTTAPAECGDGVCDDSEDVATCPADCSSAACGVGEVVGCDGQTCVDATWLGNGTCDTSLNCAENDADGGDCETAPPGTCGDGVCDPGEGSAAVPTVGLACATECSGDESCGDSCMADGLGVSQVCGACFGGAITCMYNGVCLDICTNEGPDSDACDECLVTDGCVTNVETCILNNCSSDDISQIGGTCNQDCIPAPDDCGDGFCQPAEKAKDPLALSAGCYLDCDSAEACATDCLMTSTGLSQACATCSITQMACVVDNCYDACVNPETESQDLCDTCAQGAGCAGDAYALCLTADCTLEDSAALASTCPVDCDSGDCLPGQVLDCTGACKSAVALGDGTCDDVLNCATWGFDGGDCTDPACGDQVCADGEETSCPSDCASCQEGELADCSGACSPAATYGDGTCDVHFNCEPLAFDGGDCGATCGDGLCAAGEGPVDIGPLASQCAAGCDTPECTTGCIAETGLSSGCSGCFSAAVTCVADSCYDVCYIQDDQVACDACAGACYGETFNTCLSAECANDADNAVIGGSCPMDCGDCGEGMLTDCLGECTPAGLLGDGVCQAELNCDATDSDMGDCIGSCGNGSCDDGEGPTDVMSTVFVCSMTCGPDTNCINDCLMTQTKVSLDCADCHSSFFSCMMNNCGASCDGTDEAACAECLAGAGCMEAVTACVPTDCGGLSDTAIMTGSCPGDCLDCQPGEVADCFNTCAPEGWVGDGSCDPQMDCAQLAYDGGDCTCDASEVMGCEGGCYENAWIGNEYCDVGLNCEEYAYDGGDCDTCGNAWCGPDENNSTCPEDCTEVQCETGKIETCDGLCVNSEEESSLGDGDCNEAFGCEAWNWDGGDCCPVGEAKDCYDGCANVAWVGDGECHTNFGCVEWDFDDGDCIGCGDGECGIGETPENCAEDCDAPTCADNEQLGCDWQCYPKSWYGDGSCDVAFQCEDANWDNDDCCPTGFIKGCDGQCGWEAYLGDGGCTAEFDCVEMAQDNGDCGICGDDECNIINENPTLCPADCGGSGCGEGYLDDCFGGCTPATYLGNDTCDEAFSCSVWDWDEQDCCPDGQKPTCEGGCAEGETYGDGECDQDFNCEDLSFDGGDCSSCAEGEISTCEGFCFPDWLLGTGDCDQELNCEELGWDGGDCLDNYCGDGTCDDNESLSTCLTDCEVTCGEGTVPGCWGGCVSETLLDNGSCDDALACAYHAWDNGACGYCGDFVCDPAQENASLCPGDCGESSCGDDEVNGCDVDVCVSASAVGDGVCDLSLSCIAYDWDGGDCCEDPEMEKLCGDLCVHPAWKYDGSCDPGLNCAAGEWDGGDCDECGDGVCGIAESNWNCPSDCTTVPCADGEIETCTGACVPDDDSLGDGLCDPEFSCPALEWDDGDCCSGDELAGCNGGCIWQGNQGDGTCDEALNCADYDNDGGDCCGEGLVNGCDGSCVDQASVGDGVCDTVLTCAETEWDGGDCCPPGFLEDCNDGCTSEEIFADEICDIAFACDALEWDGGTCCPGDTQPNCNGGCADGALFGDGVCHEDLACEGTGWDSGDCCPTGELPICNQIDPDVLYCSYETALGDGFCDPDFDCQDYGFDQGDCVTCGDGLCEGDETKTTCYIDCAPKPGEACYPDSGGVGTVDCDGECYMGMSSEECDQPFNCPEADWDWGECLDQLPKLVINEIDIRAEGGSETDFIELYNPTDEAISLSSYALNIYTLSGEGTNYTWVDLENTFQVVDGSVTGVLEIAPSGVVVIAQADTLSAMPNGVAMLEMPGSAADNDDGAVTLSLGNGMVDSVAWSDDPEVSIQGEGTPVAADSLSGSLSRCPDGADTGDNSSDFYATEPSPGAANFCEDIDAP
ncbi:MAG: lamin tail domain-containing protein [Myxococcota bacterium]